MVKRTHWSELTPSFNNTKTTLHMDNHHIVNSEIRVIIFFATEDGEALYSQPKQDLELVVANNHIKKQRHYFANFVHLLKAMVFPVIMYGCESWTVKKAEC